ncbi:MAG TPA: PIN domain-containing protein [Urbifossiella sp.]|nr:PIN domain-containing protein [Urbifossiella sp.]
MILLDTDHVSILRLRDNHRRTRLLSRLALLDDETIGIPIVATEETMRGWLATLAKERQARRQIYAYRELGDMFGFFAAFSIVPFDDAAVDQFEQFNSIRIGASDRKIAAIAIASGALLLTANRRDFEQIPGLRFDNWMD